MIEYREHGIFPNLWKKHNSTLDIWRSDFMLYDFRINGEVYSRETSSYEECIKAIEQERILMRLTQ